MRIVFMGTPDFAVPSLSALAEAHDVALVVTRPDAVRGRGKTLEPSPVKARALELGIEVLETKRIDDDVLERIRAAEPELIAVAAFGCILPDALLELPPLGCVNVHASLLPRWRGAAPIQRAILAGDAEAGISIMRIVSELDAGPYCAQASIEVGDMAFHELASALAELGAEELVEAIDDIADGSAVWTEQDENLVSFAAKVTKDDMKLDPADSAQQNVLRIQASSDAAPARLSLAGRGCRATRACEDASRTLDAGELSIERGRIFLGCNTGTLELLELRPDGKREMEAAAFAAGLKGAELVWERL